MLLKRLASRRYGVTVAEMATDLNVSQKTIRRDLQAFQDVGFPLEETVRDHGLKVWRLVNQRAGQTAATHTSSTQLGNGEAHAGLAHGDSIVAMELNFAFDEALALYLGRRFLDPLAGTYLWEAAQRAFKKVRACLGRKALDYLDKMASNLHHTTVGASDYSRKAELVDELMRAIEERLQTIVTYQSAAATEPVEYQLNPLGISYHRGSLYLVAFSQDHNELRHFKVDRIDEIEVGQLPFCVPDGFSLQEHFRGSFGVFLGKGDVTVKVRFLKWVARYVQEGVWHGSQRLTTERDGSVLAEFRLSSTEEIKWWILGFGKNAEVLAPESLRISMAEELAGTLEMYAQCKTERTKRRNR